MSKGAATKGTAAATDLSRFCKSSFTLTFAVEVLGIDVWHDCNEGWLDLGPCTQGIKLQYQLYPGQTYDVDILIWPHTAKIWCANQYGWVRTWQFLERRWLTFSISHLFPVRVVDLKNHVVTVIPSVGVGALGANAKNDKNVEVYLPSLRFAERRYFAPVIETEESLLNFVENLIWNTVAKQIPASYLDALFDVPQPVTDIRHQDAILHNVRETILNRNLPDDIEEMAPEPEESRPRDRRESKIPKEKEKKKVVEVQKLKFEIKLSGNAILAGAGRIVPFETFGDRPSDLGDVIVLISSNNLPAQDDQPIIFVNVEHLFEIPVRELKDLRISQLYTRWKLNEEEHDSQPQPIKSKKEIAFNDHHTILLPLELASEIIATFLDDPYEIQVKYSPCFYDYPNSGPELKANAISRHGDQVDLRGIRLPQIAAGNPKFFGYEKGDRDFSRAVSSKPTNEVLDVLIAVTKIDATTLTKQVNGFIRGEYPLYPPKVFVLDLERERICTNDINAIRVPLNLDLIVKPAVILQAQMTLEVSIGLVGCRPKRLALCFSRLYCLISDLDSIMTTIRQITLTNEGILESGKRENLLTGFALDTGDVVVVYVEGPRDGEILCIWEMTEDFYPKVKPYFSSSAGYSARLYPDLLIAAVPFNVLKMHVPLGVLLACPSVYARPALPLPTRSALLKLGRIIAGKLFVAPTRSEMPTAVELKSFRLELCVAPRPMPVVKTDMVSTLQELPRTSMQSAARISWDT